MGLIWRRGAPGQHELAVAGLTRKVKEHELSTAQHKVERHRIVAPLAGMVVPSARRWS